jgi:hypothetical protein
LQRTSENPLDASSQWPRDRKKTILLAVSIVAITLSISIIVPMMLNATIRTNLSSWGTIHIIGAKVYYDSALTNATAQIQWGKTYPGSLNNVTLYIESVSNVQTQLRLQTANWTFLNSTNAIVSGPSSATPYLNLTWNYDNTTLNPSQAIPVTLTLSVSDSQTFIQFLLDNKVTSFGFDIMINAIEQTA